MLHRLKGLKEQVPGEFPENLNTLKFISSMGTHEGVKLFEDSKTGRRYLFKSGEKMPAVPKAEEAVARLGKMLLGKGKVQAAKSVTYQGVSGVLIEWYHDAKEFGPEHKTTPPSPENMQKHFEDLVAHHILDWLASNHDVHGGNLMLTKEGELVGIDKGQAWKFISSICRDVGLTGNYGTHTPEKDLGLSRPTARR